MSKESMMDELPIVFSYTWEQGVEDGILVPIFTNRWQELSGGVPIIATAGVRGAYSDAALIEMWNDYVRWHVEVEPNLPEEERMFETAMNGERVWVIFDGSTYTMLFPHEY